MAEDGHAAFMARHNRVFFWWGSLWIDIAMITAPE